LKQIDFRHGKIGYNILMTALPLLVAQVITLLYSIVDRIYIGRMGDYGTIALGGIGICFPVITIITGITNMFGMGGSPLFSMELGKGRPQNAEKIMNIAAFMLFWSAIIITIAAEATAQPLLRLLGASDNNIIFALPYLRIYLIGTIFSMAATGLNPYVNAQGFPGIGMFTVVIGAVLNIALDPVFIFVFGMGVSGAALATVISQAASAVFVVVFLIGKKSDQRLKLISFREFIENRKIAGNICSLGLAVFIMQSTNSLVNIVNNKLLALFGGDIYISILTIVASVRQIMEVPIHSIGEGTSPTISFNYGALRPDHMSKAMRIMIISMIIYTAVSWAAVFIWPSFFISIFTSDQAFIEKAVPALHIYFFAFIFQALQTCGQTVFKALNKKKHAIFFSIFRKVVIVVPTALLLTLVFNMGVNGVFIAEPVSNVIGGTACFVTMLLTVIPEIRRMRDN